MLLAQTLPWLRRRNIGRVRAFVKTVLLATLNGRAWQQQMRLPLELREAARFFWVSVAILLLFAMFGVAFFLWAVGLGSFFLDTRDAGIPWMFEPRMLWSVGMTRWPAMFVYVGLLVVEAGAGLRSCFRRVGKQDPTQAEAAGCYAVAPLLMLPVVATTFIVWAMSEPVDSNWLRSPLRVSVALALLVVSGLIAFPVRVYGGLVAIGGKRAARWAIAGMLLRRLLAAVALLGVLPCCVGFVWIVVDTLR
ncbi:MAG: hypothetical protein ACHRHE_00035 [Tepidisphaerales bacterium]